MAIDNDQINEVAFISKYVKIGKDGEGDESGEGRNDAGDTFELCDRDDDGFIGWDEFRHCNSIHVLFGVI